MVKKELQEKELFNEELKRFSTRYREPLNLWTLLFGVLGTTLVLWGSLSSSLAKFMGGIVFFTMAYLSA